MTPSPDSLTEERLAHIESSFNAAHAEVVSEQARRDWYNNGTKFFQELFLFARTELSRRALPAPSGEMRTLLDAYYQATYAAAAADGRDAPHDTREALWAAQEDASDNLLRGVAALRPSTSPQGDESAMRVVLAEECEKAGFGYASNCLKHPEKFGDGHWMQVALAAMQRVSRIAAPAPDGDVCNAIDELLSVDIWRAHGGTARTLERAKAEIIRLRAAPESIKAQGGE